MKILWTHGLAGKDKEDLESSVRGSRIALGRLEKLLEEFISEIAPTLPEDFNSPQWAYKRAYEDGQIRAYRRVIELLTETKPK